MKYLKIILEFIKSLFSRKSNKSSITNYTYQPTLQDKNKLYFLNLYRRSGFKKTPSIKHLDSVQFEKDYEELFPKKVKEIKPNSAETIELRRVRSIKRMFFINMITNRARIIQAQYKASKKLKRA